ncbi:hypothetical protein TorRG33x02_105920, partial [Trema orientale]
KHDYGNFPCTFFVLLSFGGCCADFLSFMLLTLHVFIKIKLSLYVIFQARENVGQIFLGLISHKQKSHIWEYNIPATKGKKKITHQNEQDHKSQKEGDLRV